MTQKIIRIFPKMTQNTGGMENHLLQLSELQKKKYDVCIIYNEGKLDSKENIKLFPWLPLSKIKPAVISVLFFHISVLIQLIFSKKTKRNADFIHIPGDWSSFLFAPLYRRITACQKVTFSFHGAINEYSKFKLKLLFRQLNKANVVYATGYETYQQILPHCNAYFQPSGVNDYFFIPVVQQKNNRPTIITISNLLPKKNLMQVLYIAQRMPKFHFQIIGEGPERNKIEDYIKENRLHNVELLGKIIKHELPKYLQSAHLFLFTSLWEGTPTVILEAMASGLPIVTADVGGIGKILQNGENGIIVSDPNNTQTYFESISKLLQNDKLIHKIQRNNREKAKEFLWKKVADRITELMIVN